MENLPESQNKEESPAIKDVQEVEKVVESTPIETKLIENVPEESNSKEIVQSNEASSQVIPETLLTLAQIVTEANQNGQATSEEVIVENGEVSEDTTSQNEQNDEAASVNTEENETNGEENDSTPKIKNQDDWAKRESQLLEKISMLQKQQDDNTNKGLQIQLKVRNEENSLLKAKVVNLETELGAVLRKPNAKNKDIVSKIKKQHEELLTKAKGMIFEKTKMVKNQELQIEALTTQVSSLKEVVSITKDLLEIRNLEAKHLKERIDVMDLKAKAEKERHNLMTRKMEAGTNLNIQLKKEYETQLKLFKELKERYEEKFRALQNNANAPQTSASSQ